MQGYKIDNQFNTVGAQNLTVFRFWMVERVRLMVPAILNQNKKWVLALTILFINKKLFIYKTV